LLSLSLASGLILLAHPLFALGAWEDGQPMVVGLMAAAGLGCLGLAAMRRSRRLVGRALLSPVSLAAFALGTVGLLALPFADHPLRSLLGPAESGQGILWCFALAVFTAQAMVLRHCRRLWTIVQAVALGSTLCATVLALQGIDWLAPLLAKWNLRPETRFLGFNEYLAYAALALLVLAATETRRKWAMSLAIAAIAVLLISRCRTAFASFPLILAAAWFFRARCKAGWLVPLTLLTGLMPLAFEAIGGIAPLWSRGEILNLMLPSMQAWMGHGWGAFPDELIRNLPSAGVQIYDTQWSSVARDLFHSHNAALEGGLAAGPLGALLAVLLPAAAAFRPAHGKAWMATAFALSWAALDGFWFEIPANLPLLALACAALSSRPARRHWCLPRYAVTLSGALFLATAALLWRQAAEESRLSSRLSADDCQAPLLPFDLSGDRRGLSSILATAVRQDIDMGARLPPGRADCLTALQHQAEALPPASPSLSMALINATSAEAFAQPGSPLARSDEAQLSQTWEEDIRRLLAQAPQRLDVLPPYLNWLLTHGRSERLAPMVALAEHLDPSHPVTLWFAGVLKLQSESPQDQIQGVKMMRRAYEGKLELYMPLTQTLKEQLGY